MKVGIISDIHGNHHALEQVLKAAKKEGVDKFLVLGDIVGYYYHPEIILEQLSQQSIEMIKGNHEMLLQQLKENKIDAALLKEKYGSGHEKALDTLNDDTLNCLFALPIQKSVSIEGVSFQLNHGTPWSVDEYLYPDTERDTLEKCNSVDNDFVLVGHSHYAFSYRCKNSTLINCGSVGQSRQKGGVASWSVINTKNKCHEAKVTAYDTTALLKEVQLNDPSVAYSSKVLVR